MPYQPFTEKYRYCWSCHAKAITEEPVLIAGTSEANANLARLCAPCLGRLDKRVQSRLSKRLKLTKRGREEERQRLRAVDLLAYKMIHDPESYDRAFVLHESGHPIVLPLPDWIQYHEVVALMWGRSRCAIEQGAMTARESDKENVKPYNSHEFEEAV